ncbi:MAG: hypothetical protein KDC34_11515 [Saprospiraceae bacterium]|nr:hypothetical protein [Saprospiraceae bacterium]
MKKYLIYGLLISGIIGSCKKEEHVNPYDLIDNTQPDSTATVLLDPTSLEGLHQQIFARTCANSGCHDGTFEPDFRTIESTYNTLVNHPVIKNDPQGSFTYRVVPGDVSSSQIIARLTYDIDGNSGVMPLALEPDSDWPEMKETYIDHVKTWIMAGALNASDN